MINIPAERVAAVAAAREWVGTPWVHQGRLQGRGIDCIGLALVVARAAHALDDPNIVLPTNYGRLPHAGMLRAHIEAHTVKVPREEALVGDILLAAQRSFPTHLLILADREPYPITGPFNIIHADALPSVMRVVETSFDWKQWHITGCYRFKRWV